MSIKKIVMLILAGGIFGGMAVGAESNGAASCAGAESEATADTKIVDMKGTHKPYQGWMPISPPGPHEHRPIPTPVLKGTFTGAKRVVSVFYPYRDGANRVAGVQAAADPAATAFTLMLTDGTTVDLDETCDK